MKTVLTKMFWLSCYTHVLLHHHPITPASWDNSVLSYMPPGTLASCQSSILVHHHPPKSLSHYSSVLLHYHSITSPWYTINLLHKHPFTQVYFYTFCYTHILVHKRPFTPSVTLPFYYFIIRLHKHSFTQVLVHMLLHQCSVTPTSFYTIVLLR